MLVSARVHYASIALSELARRKTQSAPVAVREITAKHDIPGPFLVQILQTLRSAGWVQSIRGSQGGYRLLADPSELTLLDIAEAIGCADGAAPKEAAGTEKTLLDRELQSSWDRAGDAWRKVLSGITLAEIVERASAEDGTMFYI
ncbi:RrF2 family transcriptional regulator [Roseiconus lacunae]|uniref:Rrf2 family transcriptional regulator n=1 Tax=Roseiconus lacunae TaxID=2605694 RepID=A0ABT7PMD9_9BACT|nr:Rrf2 family transcriptional regulator [Roseiconus lacunae]MDM4017657.1 Rrf2 family transcriptional regulator [Roseiconus lacunae]